MYQPTPRRKRASRDADSASDLGVSALGWFVLIDVVANLILYAYFLIGEPSQELRLQLFTWCQGLAAIGAFSLASVGGYLAALHRFRGRYHPGHPLLVRAILYVVLRHESLE